MYSSWTEEMRNEKWWLSLVSKTAEPEDIELSHAIIRAHINTMQYQSSIPNSETKREEQDMELVYWLATVGREINLPPQTVSNNEID